MQLFIKKQLYFYYSNAYFVSKPTEGTTVAFTGTFIILILSLKLIVSAHYFLHNNHTFSSSSNSLRVQDKSLSLSISVKQRETTTIIGQAQLVTLHSKIFYSRVTQAWIEKNRSRTYGVQNIVIIVHKKTYLLITPVMPVRSSEQKRMRISLSFMLFKLVMPKLFSISLNTYLKSWTLLFLWTV